MKMCGWAPAELVQTANNFATEVLGEPICKPPGSCFENADVLCKPLRSCNRKQRPLQASEVLHWSTRDDLEASGDMHQESRDPCKPLRSCTSQSETICKPPGSCTN